MAKKHDIVVFGGTGFTGKHIVKELIKIKRERGYGSFSFGIAGRSHSKLQNVLNESDFGKHAKDNYQIPILEADVNNSDSLRKMVESARVLINCVGPFSKYGEPVYKACISSGTDYVDICGETQFMEEMFFKYHTEATEKGVLLVSACGFDSIPADLGVVYCRSQLESNWQLSSIECFLEHHSPIRSNINYGTYESLIYSLENSNNLSHLRKLSKLPKLVYLGPRKTLKKIPYYEDRLHKWCMVFPGSDAAIVRKSQQLLLQEQPTTYSVQYFEYIAFSSFIEMMGVSLLLMMPSFFTLGRVTFDPPKEDYIKNASFKMNLFATVYKNIPTTTSSLHGSKNPSTLTTCVQGPEPAYVTTPICAASAAFSILKMRDEKISRSGVLTPALAFKDSDMIQRLCDSGVKFSVVEKNISKYE